MRERRYWPYTTPESKRQLAAEQRQRIAEHGNTLGEDPEFWEALAELQDQGRLDEWKVTFEAWEDTKPHPRDLLTVRNAAR